MAKATATKTKTSNGTITKQARIVKSLRRAATVLDKIRVRSFGTLAATDIDAAEVVGRLVSLATYVGELPPETKFGKAGGGKRERVELAIGGSVSLREKFSELYDGIVADLDTVYHVTALNGRVAKVRDDEGGELLFPIKHLSVQ